VSPPPIGLADRDPAAPRTLDANEAVASVAYRLSEVIAIYPITPSSSMAEQADEWATARTPNLWGTVPEVIEMQSEGGAAGAIHGALQGGALATTFTASQGLLLMIPNMFKIAGELTPFVMHVSARTIATHALSIFGDHSDVMACRSTGFAMLCGGSVQEAQDLACVAHAATLRARVPFVSFFDGFRTSHEISKIAPLPDAALAAMFDDPALAAARTAHRARALTPDHPVVRGTAQNPDTFFQAREACNPYYVACPAIVREELERFAQLTGRRYRTFDYVGHPDAERVIIMMGSGAEAAHELVEHAVARGDKVGLVKVRLFRPFVAADLLAALPPTARAIAVLDRTKEPGAAGEPLFLDVVAALYEASTLAPRPRVIGGRYGLASKELTPAMVAAIFDELASPRPRPRFTIGITDDVSHLSLAYDPELDLEPPDVVRAVFYGLGADGTVGANKSSIKIIGEQTPLHAQGYFVYDSKKSGAMTVSHLRFGPRPFRSSYLIRRASFVAVHQWSFLDRYDVLALAAPGATLLLNAPYPADEVWAMLPREVQETILERRLRVHAIDALAVARRAGMGNHINTVMQTCFFALAGLFPLAEAIAHIKRELEQTYRKKGPDIVAANLAVVDDTLAHLHEIAAPATAPATATRARRPVVPAAAPELVQRVTAAMIAGHGDALPVSAFPPDGTWPTGTAKWEKRDLAHEIPAWDPRLCIQCNKCALVCPHAAIRVKTYPPAALAGAPPAFKSWPLKARTGDDRYTVQVAPEDCTGCGACVEVCPAADRTDPRHKAIDMVPQPPLREAERANFEFFLTLPEVPRDRVSIDAKGSQLLEPLFEFSGACAGCGETPYLKLLTQLFGDRALIANATGCSSIYGGNLPTTPYTTNRDGRGPAWANSLFEDNAEFGLGLRLAVDQHAQQARDLLRALAGELGDARVSGLLEAEQHGEAAIAAQRARVAELRQRLAEIASPLARRLEGLADYLVRKSVWIVGGDGWAYDIGYGGLDHVLAQGRDVNVLVLDTQVYSNTGGQQSKATPLGAVAKFASAGKAQAEKDLGLLAMAYGNVYVAQIAYGAKDSHAVHALAEADAWPGPSLVLAYSHCIAHGYDLARGAAEQKLAVETGYWPLYRHDPRRAGARESALRLDSNAPRGDLAELAHNEMRFRQLEQQDPARFLRLMARAQRAVAQRYALYRHLAEPFDHGAGDGAAPPDKEA
jgi:pyruvate-ferredoxin/flavodoxin oxidoreductase